MPIEKTETQAAETPKLVDLIAEAVSAQPEEASETVDEDVQPSPGETEGSVEADVAAPDVSDSDTPEVDTGAVAASPADESPDDAAVTKELADLGITKPDSQARFRELANEAKEGRYYREQVEKQNEVFRHLEHNGVTGEQFGAMVGYLSHVNSNDPTRLRAAFDTLSSELQTLGKRLGIEAPGYDPLSFHPDLKRRVDEGEIDRETAVAWAKDKDTATKASKADEIRNQRETEAQTVERARADLTELGNELSKRDPFYDKVYAMLVPSLRPVLARLPPSEWVAATADAYRDLRGQLQAAGQLVATPSTKAVVKRPDPANAGRPNGAAGTPEPKSGQDAVLKMFGYSES